MDGKIRVFLAHASEDQKRVIGLYHQLSDAGFKPWMDEFDLLPGQNWREEIDNAINQSDVFLACLSKHSVKKEGYIQKEFRQALNRYAEKTSGSIYFIPVRLDECDIPDLRIPQFGINLHDFHWVDFWKPNGFEKLKKALLARTTSFPGEVTYPGKKLLVQPMGTIDQKMAMVLLGTLEMSGYLSGKEAAQVDKWGIINIDKLWNINLFLILGVEDGSLEERQAFLRETLKVIISDFLEVGINNTPEDLIPSRTKNAIKEYFYSGWDTEQEQFISHFAASVDYMWPVFGKPLILRCLQLKAELAFTRISGLRELWEGKSAELDILDKAERLCLENRWQEAVDQLNSLRHETPEQKTRIP